MEPMKPMKPLKPMAPMENASADWWPEGLGSPASSGSQGEWRYAFFPGPRRLAIERHGAVTQYDTGDHAIAGIRQAQDGGTDGPAFTSQHGHVKIEELTKIA